MPKLAIRPSTRVSFHTCISIKYTANHSLPIAQILSLTGEIPTGPQRRQGDESGLWVEKGGILPGWHTVSLED